MTWMHSGPRKQDESYSMSVLSSLLVSACVASSNMDSAQVACEKAAEAGARQSGILQEVDSIEEEEIKMLTKKAEQDLGKDGAFVVAGGVFVARTISSQSVVFGLPNFGVCDSVKADINSQRSIVKLEWKF